MTKQELIQRITKKTGLDPELSRSVVEAFFEVVKTSLSQGEPLYVRTFGSFILKQRARKVARNIKANTTVIVDAHPIPYFKPSPEFLSQVREQEVKSGSKK